MTYPRHTQISLAATPYYHCVARCVRRAWLWGFDSYAGKDYSHRKDWVLDRLGTLAPDVERETALDLIEVWRSRLSYQATQFRIWAVRVLREFIAKGFVLDDVVSSAVRRPSAKNISTMFLAA